MSQAIAAFPLPLAGDADDEAVRRARQDPEAFSVLYERYAARVFRFLRPFVASNDEAADLTQQVFLNAWQAFPRYKPGRAPFAAWLFRIARNLATDAYRRRKPVMSLAAASLMRADGADPEAAALAAERLRALESHVARLDPRRRELLALRFGAGLTSREIAAVVSKSEASVKKQLTRTISALKELYHDEQF